MFHFLTSTLQEKRLKLKAEQRKKRQRDGAGDDEEVC